MTKWIIDPTKEEMYKASIDVLRDENNKLEKDNFIILKNNSKLNSDLGALQAIVEQCRIRWTSIGAEQALREMVLDVKHGKTSARYRSGELTIDPLTPESV